LIEWWRQTARRKPEFSRALFPRPANSIILNGMEVEFDKFAGNYEATLQRGLRFTGESPSYFARARVQWLARIFRRRGFQVGRILDYGSGTGISLPFFFELLGAQSIVAVDVSPESVKQARQNHPDPRLECRVLSEYRPGGDCDLVYCNGVFHHIPPPQRGAAIGCMAAALRPGGWLAFWENNPWNPMTRFMMRRVAFDREAILVWPSQARRLAKDAGLEVGRTDFYFIFPNFLAWWRVLEPALISLPLGGQYLVLAQKTAMAT
jgi:SAM-dependent methyltransferase